MESSSRSFVYVRRGEGERESNTMEDGRDAKRDDGRSGHRFEGKVMRKKRGLRDVASADKKHLSKFKRISERGNSPPDRDRDDERRHGSPSGKELSWKEIAERKQKRNRLQNGKVDSDGDGSGKMPDYRKERIDRGKVQSGGHFKGKGVQSKFPTKRKPGSSEFDVQNGDTKRKKSSEPIKKRRHRLILQDHSDDDDYYVRPLPVKRDPNPLESQVVEGKEAEKEADPDVAAVNSTAQADQGVRKSSRVPKRKVLEDFEGDAPEVGLPKSGRHKQGDGDGKYESHESDSNDENEAGASDRAASESDPDAEDWNDEMDSSKSKQTKTKIPNSISNGAKGNSAPLTARQRSILLEKDGDASGVNLIEFPDGLSHFSRRGATKLSDQDRQAKKAEAASRRKQVVEKAAKEMQATAIQKILGQDSSRRKKEDRLQKQREEIQQEKKAAAMEAPLNSVRWTIGPQGTTVSWSQDAKLPEIFYPSLYPPPPEKCAAPSCANPRKYKCSKSSLPLCSLQCYRAVHSTAKLVST